jgi:hypothetical protein
MPSIDHAIDWSNAGVLAKDDVFSLRVPLARVGVASPSEVWNTEFMTRALSQEAEARGQRWSGVRFHGGMIEVEVVEPGAEDELRKYLDELVAQTNRSAAKIHEIADQEAAKKAELNAARTDTADDMTERFRSN